MIWNDLVIFKTWCLKHWKIFLGLSPFSVVANEGFSWGSPNLKNIVTNSWFLTIIGKGDPKPKIHPRKLTWNHETQTNWWCGSMFLLFQGLFSTPCQPNRCHGKVADSPPGWASRSFALDEWHQWHSYMQDWPQPLNSWGMGRGSVLCWDGWDGRMWGNGF